MWVVKLGGSLTEQPPDTSPLRDWLAMLAQDGAGRVVIVPGGGGFADAVRQAQVQWRFDDLAAHNMALLAMAQTAHLLCGLHPALRRCDREDQLPAVLEQGHAAVWSPLELQRERADADTNWDISSDSLALGLALRLRATRLVVVKSCAVDPSSTLAQLSATGIVDRCFAMRAAGHSVRIDVVNHAQRDAIRAALRVDRADGR